MKGDVFPPLLAEECTEKHAANDTEEQDSGATRSSSRSWIGYILGCTHLILMCSGYGIATLLSQVAGVKSNVFQLCTIRYLIMVFIGYFVVLQKEYSLRMESAHYMKLLVCGIIHVLLDAGFFFIASFTPLGVLDGLKAAFMIVMSAGYDFYQRRVTKYTLIAALVAFVGILLLSQPWSKTKVFSSVSIIPCEVWEMAPGNLNESILYFNNNTDVVVGDTPQRHYNIWGEILGYSFMILMALGITIRGFLFKDIMVQYPVSLVIFWSSLVECIIVIIINGIQASVYSVPYFDLPNLTYCCLFTILFIICATIGNLGSVYSYNYALVTTVSLAHVSLAVSLYLCQRTFLKTFYPGNANTLEVIGVVVVIIGVLITPCSLLLSEQKCLLKSK